jgi:hypothetical protein
VTSYHGGGARVCGVVRSGNGLGRQAGHLARVQDGPSESLAPRRWWRRCLGSHVPLGVVAIALPPSQLRVKTLVRPSGHGGGGAMRHDPLGFVVGECSRLSVAVACSEWYGDPIDPTSNLVTHCIACTYIVHATKSSFHHLFPLVG